MSENARFESNCAGMANIKATNITLNPIRKFIIFIVRKLIYEDADSIRIYRKM